MTGEKVNTVGQLIEALEEYDEDTLVRVNDDMMHFPPQPRERNGVVEL